MIDGQDDAIDLESKTTRNGHTRWRKLPIRGLVSLVATLAARALDRVLPGLGYWLVPPTAWLFVASTMISWSHYGEQGVVHLFGRRG